MAAGGGGLLAAFAPAALAAGAVSLRLVWLWAAVALPLPAGAEVDAAAAEFDLDCAYAEVDEITMHRACARSTGTGPVFAPQHLRRMAYSLQGLAAVAVGSQWYYLRRDGSTLPVAGWDNGPEPYAEGLVRARVGARMGYYDVEFHPVIPPRYDWGTRFARGRALVCVGCAAVDDGDGHRHWAGGRWGAIDRDGRLLAPLEYPAPEQVP